jgi:hypothetical protein
MAKKHIKKCSIFLAIKEMQINTMLKFYLTAVRMDHQEHKQKMLVSMWGKRNPHTLLVGM